VEWAVPVSDEAGIWRVVVVYTDNSVDSLGRGAWVPLELADDGSGTWRGSLAFTDASLVTYVVQAVDNRGNVSWLEYESTKALPASGIPLGIALPVDVVFGVLFADDFETGDTSRWSATVP